MIRHAEPARALVLGLGRFGGGREAARFLARRGYVVRIADRDDDRALAESTAALRDLERVEWCLGREDDGLLDHVDLVVVNPAVPSDHPLVAGAAERGIRTTQEVDLFLEHYPGRVVLVTGTNGKSTTTALIGHALARAGRSTLVGGNLGNSLLADEPRWCPGQVAVLEISSFQLERLAPTIRVAGSVITRVTCDHLDRHGTLASYRAAKSRAAAAANEFVVHCADDPVAESFATHARRLRHAASPASPDPAPDAWVDDAGFLQTSWPADPGPIVHRHAIRLVGAFQSENILAASLAAAALGVARSDYGHAMAFARPLPHRLQCVAERRGVRVFDNAVSTELQSTLSAIDAIGGTVHWVGGGKSKDGDFRSVARAVAPRVASAHLFGAAASPLGAELHRRPEGVACTEHNRLEAALDAALQSARRGDTVLFSPGFASFDQYRNFGARAAAFDAWLSARQRDAVETRSAHPGDLLRE